MLRRELNNMPVKAIAKGVKQSPRKVAVVAALVRGRTVDDALVILANTPRRSAIAVSKVISSARSNADYNHNYIPSTLKITEIIVTPGPRSKRFRPIARGSAHPYMKRTSHIRVVVDGEVRKLKTEVQSTSASKSKAVASPKEKK